MVRSRRSGRSSELASPSSPIHICATVSGSASPEVLSPTWRGSSSGGIRTRACSCSRSTFSTEASRCKSTARSWKRRNDGAHAPRPSEKHMAFILALLEGSAFFAAVAAMIFVWTRPIVTDWIDILAIFGQIVSIALCCIIAFYYNDLYDLRIVRSFGGFAARLLQSFGVTLILLGIFYMLFPETKIAGGPFVSSLLIIFGLVLPLRATSYGLVRSGLLTRRVLVLGRSPLAHRIIAEIEAQPHLRYVVVGIVDDPAASREPPADYPLLGPLDHLDKIIEEVRPDIILVALGEQRGRLPLTPLLEARTRRIVVAEGNAVYERLAGKLALES